MTNDSNNLPILLLLGGIFIVVCLIYGGIVY